ncbi:MAG TPA: nuclear transport factor 2 family protein [Methylothermaceae bacterium]|nr:MAG: hypothetical protein AXA67_08665 [Methylothermaceae bacteria B42]HEB77660.1 nuclear transport factor 2 family protein [Methylothermaceae bacterium]
MISAELAWDFAKDWVDAWNAHDLEWILSHYADDIQVTSPIARQLTGTAEIHGKKALREYFSVGLAHYPDLSFRLLNVFSGQDSIVLHYVNQNSVQAAEWMRLNEEGKVVEMIAHYEASLESKE